MVARSALHTVIDRAARKAGRSLVHDFGEVENLQVSVKGPSDFVSTADRQAERLIRIELERARPGYGFLMEESGESPGDGRNRWIVDPLDGTTNFLHGIPHFAVSIALERDGEIIAGAIYNPVQDEFYWAEKGRGAFLNDRRLRVSGRRKLEDAIIGTGTPARGRGDHVAFLRSLRAVMAATAGVRRAGAAALDLAYVAAGRLDGFWETGLNSWDLAAGLLLIREAGGFSDDLHGRGNPMTTGNVVTANTLLQAPLVKLLRDSDPA